MIKIKTQLLPKPPISQFVFGGAFIVLIFLLFASCIYKAGNRHSDINYLWESSVSPYYIKKYMKTIDSFYVNRGTITSEVVNYPENYIPVTDSVLRLKYVIGFNNVDSLKSLSLNTFTLASIFDFKKGKWVTSIDSLTHNELNEFKKFFQDSVIAKTVELFKNKLPDSLLYVGSVKVIELKPVQ
jgi:hypothetical protein